MTLGRKRVLTAGVEALRKCPEPPEWMGAEARAEWQRVVPTLVRRRVLSKAELQLVETYCVTAAIAARAQAEAEKLPSVFVTGKNGVQRQHPAVVTARQFSIDVRRLAGELGLTPASRHLRGGEAPKNDQEETDAPADDMAGLAF